MRIAATLSRLRARPPRKNRRQLGTALSVQAGAGGNASSKHRAMILLAVVAAATLALTPKAPSQIVADALVKLQAHLDVANRAMGEDQAEALGSRLADDIEAFDDPTMPGGYTQATYQDRLRNTATLDASIVDQVLSGKYEP